MTQNTEDAGASNEVEHAYREATKPRPETSGVGEYCQPGDRREPRWIVMYDDADRSLSIFEDEQDARDCFANSEAMGWNCWLFSPTARRAPTAEQAEGVRASLSERLIAAIEGECDGLAITDEQASNVLAYLQYGSPLDDVRRDAERYRKLRDADINAIHKGGVFAGLTPDNVVINGEDLDIAVDLLIDAPAASTGEQESSDGL
jgi:hypothetical protein